LLRQSGLGPWHTIWAEDGGIFYQGTPSVGHLLDGYAGYVELLPRLLGLGAHLVPVDRLAWYFAIAGAAVTTLCAAAVWRFSSQLVTSVVLRAMLALSVALLPALLLEQLANGVNSIWALTFAAWWAILYRPSSTRDAVPAAVVVFLAVTSQAIALAYAPVMVFEAWRRRDRRTLVVAGAFAAGAALQLLVIAAADTRSQVGENTLGDLPKLYAVRVLGSALVGESNVGGSWDSWGLRFGVVASLVIVVVVVILGVLAAPRSRVIGVFTVAYSAGIWVLCVWGRGSALLRIPEAGYSSVATRWTSLSVWLLLSGLFILASSIPARTLRNVVVAVLAVQFAFVAITGFRGTNPRSDPPTWTDSIRAVRGVCASRHVEQAEALVSPPNPGLGIVLRCASLR
jgi:hypothetical protein